MEQVTQQILKRRRAEEFLYDFSAGKNEHRAEIEMAIDRLPEKALYQMMEEDYGARWDGQNWWINGRLFSDGGHTWTD